MSGAIDAGVDGAIGGEAFALAPLDGSTTGMGAPSLDRDALATALEAVAAGATDRDREPRFPDDAFAALGAAGALTATVGDLRRGESVAGGWDLLRRVAAADSSVGRILDGHLNAIERLEAAAVPELRDAELAKLAAGPRLLGVWGADPGPGEGAPARAVETAGGLVLRGAKTFCSGAGGVDAALVMVGNDGGEPPLLVLVECDERAALDRSWYRAAGLRASESHRVEFRDAPIVAVLGAPGELGREPFFSRDACRTAASWAGMVDAAADAALAELAARRAAEPLSQLAAGRIEAARGTVDAWLALAATRLDAVGAGESAAPAADGTAPAGNGTAPAADGVSGPSPRQTSVAMRAEIAAAAGRLLGAAASACGSHPFVTGGDLDRARRDLETFLLQHRLEPLLVRVGAARLEALAAEPEPEPR